MVGNRITEMGAVAADHSSIFHSVHVSNTCLKNHVDRAVPELLFSTPVPRRSIRLTGECRLPGLARLAFR
ncbi:hypothetical protein HanRHA438_Chr08g0356921 [Helianthus annuus]|nr:hypothetical protein HanIR_Chr08g0372771 [Helianthus annuus]KAJ0898448.1 hypothetical protein HanRHA438_Chr08g0356921 [Helianthus annuus]